jgi:hypothetical protein
MVNNGEAKMQALYVEQDFDDRMGYMLVENETVIEIVNQIENFGVNTQYQRHWEIIYLGVPLDADLILLTEAKARELLAQFVALGGVYVEDGVALYDHGDTDNIGKFASVKEQLSEFVAEKDEE